MNYSEVGIPVRRIPVAVKVSPVVVSIESRDRISQIYQLGDTLFTEISREKFLYFMA